MPAAWPLARCLPDELTSFAGMLFLLRMRAYLSISSIPAGVLIIEFFFDSRFRAPTLCLA